MKTIIKSVKITNAGKILRVIASEEIKRGKFIDQVYEFEAKDLSTMQHCEFCQSSEKRN